MLKSTIAAAALALGGAVGFISAAEADDLTVSFKLGSGDRCSRSSPEIQVGNVPAGTVRFKVRLRDRNKGSWNHGGGTVPADPSGIIPKGALKDGYNGPCPPSGERHTYQFDVKALDAGGNELAEGSAKQTFP